MILDDGDSISYNIITEFWKDTGTPNDIIHANKIVLENMDHKKLGTTESGVECFAKYSLGKNSIITPDLLLYTNTFCQHHHPILTFLLVY